MLKTATTTEWLFYHLWKKDEETGKPCMNVLIPDTIIYRWSNPYYWYYTTLEGLICRKSKNRVDHQVI